MKTSLLKAVDAVAGFAICRAIGALSPRRADDVSSSPSDELLRPGLVRRILVIRPGGLGDMLLLLPALTALQEIHPEAVIDIVCERRNRGAFAFRRTSGRIFAYDENPAGLLAALAKGGWDAVVDTEQFHNFSAVFAALTRAPVRIGFGVNPARLGAYTHLIGYSLEENEARSLGRLFAPFGVKPDELRFRGSISVERSELPEEFTRFASERGGAIVAIGAGASVRHKGWSAEKFAGLADWLIALGHSVVLLGDQKDVAVSEKIQRGNPEILSLAGRVSLRESAAVLSAVTLFVGIDSALSHLAAGVGTPAVVLFGPSPAEKWGSHGPEHVVIRKKIPCSPCSSFAYIKPCVDVECMARIGVEEVLEAVKNRLGQA